MNTKQDIKARIFWQEFKTSFFKKSNNHIYQSWLEPIVSYKIEKRGDNKYLILHVPSKLHKKWIEKNIDFKKHLQQFYDGSCKIHLEVIKDLCLTKKAPHKKKTFTVHTNKTFYFNTNYTFDKFVIGKNNSLAYHASLSVTKNKQAFNPLFIYSPSGLGKTHLLHAIGQKCIINKNRSKIIYISAERFLNEYIRALQTRQIEQFRKKFRNNCDLLLMDDIQIIARGKEIQEEFFHTFNDLETQKTQVVICCDKPPNCVPRLEERIKTRLEGGLMVDIAYPDQETRLAILKNKIDNMGLFVSTKILDKIASTCKRSIREMEGVLNKIKIMTELHNGKLDIKELDIIFRNLKKDINIQEIQHQVSKYFNISLNELISNSRKKQVLIARQTAMYLIRIYLKESLKDIALNFRKKDHTTVLHSIQKVEKMIHENKKFKSNLKDLQEKINRCYNI